ncbi:WD repeat-containing protein 44 [Tribolium castaneum]|uniref:WD repeat-containing protein 44 n=1 Tax=Tribolium castaneum TaxID=7070 RepID=D6WEM4_TRICA|nr:PREDICTED: WD repeat-containing protein 44 [Tribolium castaneum]EEZ99884.1 WD repeat-containing protein 44-like Protein [Tribolium castaneum]|eukprot:XP_008191241.1 PREDICTED: WD repeat-containing protein 44 [Tribolium castaneum]
MSSSSDSEEFYDAEDLTPSHGPRKNRKSSKESLTQRASSEPNVSTVPPGHDERQLQSVNEIVFVEPQKRTPLGGRRKFKELRQKLQHDDEDCQTGNVTPPNSQTSSVEGVFAASNKTSHPFRIIEQDTVSLQSINSLGRLTRILGGIAEGECGRKAVSVSALSSSSLDSGSTPSSKGISQYPSNATLTSEKSSLPLQEPDVIASTKASSSQKSDDQNVAPVAPPRRKKKNKAALQIKKSASSATFESSDLASPASTIESLTREFEHSLDRLPSGNESQSSTLRSGHSLDIKQALKGQFVVKPQDNESLKAGEGGKVKSEVVQAASPRGSSTRSSVGHYSLGPHRGTHQSNNRSTKERRKSAGDENMLKDANLKVRTHTDSGKQLSDFEILEQVTVLNLDTGERVPLSVAEDKLPQCINPLSLHIMRLTSEYVSSSSMEKEKESDEESEEKKIEIPIVDDNEDVSRMRKKTAMLKKFVGTAMKKTMHKAKSIAQEVSHARHKEDIIDIVDVVNPGEQTIKLKASSSHKGPYEFEKVEHVQELKDEHEGPIWCMKFSCCGRLLATAGQDKVLRIWIVRDAFPFFQDMRTKYNAEKVSPTPSQESLVSHHSGENSNLAVLEAMTSEECGKMMFMPKPFCTYTGHTSDLLDVSWSKNYFILSSSMDKTVRLWHISRKECLCCFQHIDFVTAIVFHPRDDRYFLSGSLDGKLRLWNIPDKKVAVWNEVEGNPKLITAANFCQNGKFAVVGTYDGRCIFYITDQLKYHTQIHVRSSRGRNATGRKISGIEPMPGEDKILVTSNDSRIRLYDLRDLNVSCKYKGYVNMSSQIKASFSHDGKYIVSGSENRDIYIWKTNHDYAKFSSVRRDRNDFWEAIKAHNAVVTCAIFAPNPEGVIKMIEESCKSEETETNDKQVEDPVVEQHTKGCGGYVLISADFNGCIKVFINKMKPKHSSLPVSAMVSNTKIKKT